MVLFLSFILFIDYIIGLEYTSSASIELHPFHLVQYLNSVYYLLFLGIKKNIIKFDLILFVFNMYFSNIKFI